MVDDGVSNAAAVGQEEDDISCEEVATAIYRKAKE